MGSATSGRYKIAEEDKVEKMPMIGFRISTAKKKFLEKAYGKSLPELLREQADVLIVRSLKNNKGYNKYLTIELFQEVSKY